MRGCQATQAASLRKHPGKVWQCIWKARGDSQALVVWLPRQPGALQNAIGQWDLRDKQPPLGRNV